MGGAVIGLLVVWRLGTALLSGGSDAPPPTAATGPTGSVGTGDAPPPPPGSRSSTFPTAVNGTRVQLKVFALGDDPADCEAESLEVAGHVRTVYHHGCVDEVGSDRYFFLVRVTNGTDARVYVSLDAFAVTAEVGEARVPFATPPIGFDPTRFLQASRTVAAGESLKGWVTVDGTDGFTPAGLTYADGEETLIVVFDGEWA